MIHITPEIKRSLPWFTGYSFTKFHWNPSITFSTIRHAILNTCPDPDPDPAQNVIKSCRPPQLSTHKISSKSVHIFFRYPTKIQKFSVNPVPGSAVWSGSGWNLINSSRPLPRLSTHKISSKYVHNLLRYPAKIPKSGSWIRTMIRIRLRS